MTKSRGVLRPEEETSRWSHRNKGLCDRRPTCPTALLLVLHITKSHVAIPHIYRFLLGISHTFHPQSKTFHPRVHWFSFTVLLHSLTSSPSLPSCFPSCSPSRFTFCIQRPSGAGALSVCWNLLAVVDHKLNTERKCVCQFCWWCACTCMAAPLLASLSALPPPSDVSDRSVMS